MRVLPCGTDALLVELRSLDEVAALRAGLEAARLPEIVELVPAARTVLVAVRPGAGLDGVREALRAVDVGAAPPVSGSNVTVPVHYDGPDLELVAQTASLTTDEVVALHSGATYTVAFSGFAPGFGYLVGLPDPLHQPRLERPRDRVPAGSVGIAGEFTGAYPRASPGGWRLLGRTDAVLFDPDRDEPALLRPGDTVRFEPC